MTDNASPLVRLGKKNENFTEVTIQQVMRVDRQVFMFMIKEDVNLRRLPDNTQQMDTMIMEALRSYEVSFHLVPLPKTATPVVKTVTHGGAWNADQEHWTPGAAPYHKGKGTPACQLRNTAPRHCETNKWNLTFHDAMQCRERFKARQYSV